MAVRILIGFGVCLAGVLACMPSFIQYLKKLSFRQTVSEYALADDKKKEGTPIMGGILFIVFPVVMTLILSGRGIHRETVLTLLAFIGYGLIGFTDDYLIAVKHNNDGVTPKQKFGLQILLAAVFFFLYRGSDLSLHWPFTNAVWNLGSGYFILELLMFSGASNATNLTDGMDGLCAGCSVIALIPFLIVSVVKGQEELAVFCGCLIGGLLGYLHYNKKPARVFMGDTGALALGAVMAAMAMILKIEIAFIFIAGIFVTETVCVLIQQISVRTGHGKVFSYTPIHYAFRLKGISEVRIVHSFWLIEAGFALLGLLLAMHSF